MQIFIKSQRTVVEDYIKLLIEQYIKSHPVQFLNKLSRVQDQVYAKELGFDEILPAIVGMEFYQQLLGIISPFPDHFQKIFENVGVDLYLFTLMCDVNQSLLDKCFTDLAEYQQKS